MMKAMRFRTWASQPIVTLGEQVIDLEAYRWAAGRWVEVDPIEVIFKASEIGEVRFGLRYPGAYRARRWLPKTEAANDPEDIRLDNMIAALEEHKAKRRAEEGHRSARSPRRLPTSRFATHARFLMFVLLRLLAPGQDLVPRWRVLEGVLGPQSIDDAASGVDQADRLVVQPVDATPALNLPPRRNR